MRLALDARDHLTHVQRLVGTRFQDGKALGEGAPAQDANVYLSGAPEVHQAGGGLVDVDRTGADEGTAVVIDDIHTRIALDLEDGAEGVDGPIGSGAADRA